MLNMVKGCRVPYPEQLYEGYIIQDNRIIANINADKIMDVFQHYYSSTRFYIKCADGIISFRRFRTS